MITRTQPNFSSAALRLSEKADVDPRKVWRKILISLAIMLTALVLTVFCIWAIWAEIARSEADKLLFAFVLLGSLIALLVGGISIIMGAASFRVGRRWWVLRMRSLR